MEGEDKEAFVLLHTSSDRLGEVRSEHLVDQLAAGLAVGHDFGQRGAVGLYARGGLETEMGGGEEVLVTDPAIYAFLAVGDITVRAKLDAEKNRLADKAKRLESLAE